MSSSAKKITLKSSDGEEFEVDEAVALESQAIKNTIVDGFAGNEIHVANVAGKTLSKVVEYLDKHVESASEDLGAWDEEFARGYDGNAVFDIAVAAKHLDIKSLVDLACRKVADLIRDKTVEEVRKMFNMVNDRLHAGGGGGDSPGKPVGL